MSEEYIGQVAYIQKKSGREYVMLLPRNQLSGHIGGESVLKEDGLAECVKREEIKSLDQRESQWLLSNLFYENIKLHLEKEGKSIPTSIQFLLHDRSFSLERQKP